MDYKEETFILALTFHVVLASSELFQVLVTQSFKVELIMFSYVLKKVMTCYHSKNFGNGKE